MVNRWIKITCPKCGDTNARTDYFQVHCVGCENKSWELTDAAANKLRWLTADPDRKEKSLPHYTGKTIQPLDYILNNEMNFCEGNIIKYVTRYKEKNGVEDLRKARVYLDALIEYYNKKNEQHNTVGE